MIREIITFMSTPCQHHVRHMGYLYETIAMRERYRRNRSSWQHHIEKSRESLISAAEKARKRNRIIILGSGILLDVPMTELAGMFKEVILADIVHLPEIRKRVKRFPNARLMEHDASGISERLYHNIKQDLNDLPNPLPGLPVHEADLVVSLNMLSQLPVVPHLFVMKNMPAIQEEDSNEWCRLIIESHVAWLKSLPCATCLISDHAFSRRDRNGEIRETGSTLYGFQLPEPEKSWTWNLAPQGEESGGMSKELHVGSWS